MKHEHMRSWTPDEDNFILGLYAMVGPKWTVIAEKVSANTRFDRSAASVRNRFFRMKKGEQKRVLGEAKNRCSVCGLRRMGHVCKGRREQESRPQQSPALPALPALPAFPSVYPDILCSAPLVAWPVLPRSTTYPTYPRPE